jgi:hypothetical protein
MEVTQRVKLKQNQRAKAGRQAPLRSMDANCRSRHFVAASYISAT